MTRALPSLSSPQFLSYEMFSGAIQTDPTSAIKTPVAQTPIQVPQSEDIKKVKRLPARPTYSKMIYEAIFENHEKRKGTSLAAIKKHLQQKYGIDVKKSAKKICKCIRESVDNGGQIKQMTGHGANGSFMLTYYARKKLQIEKEKSLQVIARTRKIKSVPTQEAKVKVRKPSKAASLEINIPVTRMRVK